MSTDEDGKPVSWMNVNSFVDGSVRVVVHLMPGSTASSILDAAYAVLDEFAGINAIDPDEGKPPKQETVQ